MNRLASALCRRLSVVLSLLTFGVLVAFGGQVRSANAQSSSDTTEVAFEEAIRIALDQNTDLKRAQADVRQRETEVQSEWMDFMPDLSVSTSVSRRFGRNFSQVTGGFTTRSTDFLNMGASSSLTLFNGFENTASLSEARDRSEASRLDLQRTRREVVFTVMEQYISLIESREVVRVREEELEARRQQLRQIEAFVDAGSRPVSDLYQEQANVADAEQQLLQAQREREINKTRLIQTLQLNPRQPYQFLIPDVAADTIEAKSYDLSSLMDESFKQRLDLRVAEVERRAAEQNVRAAHSSYYPTLSIRGNYGTDWTSRGRLPDPNNPGRFIQPGFTDQLDNNRGGGVSLSLRFPIFDQFQRNTQVERARVQKQNAQYAFEDQRQQVALQVRQAYLDHQNAVQQLEAANKRLTAAEQARASVQERYNLGSASIVELQNATRDYVDAASQQVRARYNLLFQQKKIEYHVGRLDPRQPALTAQSTN